MEGGTKGSRLPGVAASYTTFSGRGRFHLHRAASSDPLGLSDSTVGCCFPFFSFFLFCGRAQANLPLLQRELLHCARAAKQTPAQYLSQHEHLLLSTTLASSPDSSELLMEPPETGSKRPSPGR